MSIAIFSPYGLASEETGLLALLGAYLQQGPYSVTQLYCNGVFSLCDRDGDHGWRRGLRACFGCSREQRSISDWSGVATDELSLFLSPADIDASKRWALGLRDEFLIEAHYNDITLFPLVQASFRARFGTDVPESGNTRHIEILRRLLVSTVRMLHATHAFIHRRRITTCFVSSGEDFLSSAMIHQAQANKVEVARFRWDISSRSVRISHPRGNREFDCPLVFENVTSLRRDARTWPRELTRVLDEVLVFLEVTRSQIELPLAQ